MGTQLQQAGEMHEVMGSLWRRHLQQNRPSKLMSRSTFFRRAVPFNQAGCSWMLRAWIRARLTERLLRAGALTLPQYLRVLQLPRNDILHPGYWAA